MAGEVNLDERERVSARVHQAAAIAFLALALYGFWKAWHWQYLTPIGPGAGFFPFWVAGALILLSLALLGQTFTTPGHELDHPFFPERAGALRVVLTLVALALFVWAIEKAGFAATAIVFSLVLFRLYGRLRWVIAIGLSLAAGPLVHYVFHHLLGVRLPVSPLGLWPLVGL